MAKILAAATVLAAFAVPLAGAADDVAFTLSPNVNDWWVEVSTNASPSAVTASINGGPAIALTHEWWGGWGVSTHVAPGSSVVFTATVDGRQVTSQAFTWPTTATTTGGGSSSSSSSGATSSYSQSVDLPPQNVLAALALGHSGFLGPGFGIGSIANVQRSASNSEFLNNQVSLNPEDALVVAALGGNLGFLGLSTGASPYLYGYGSPYSGTGGSSALMRCLEERALVERLGLGTENQYVC